MLGSWQQVKDWTFAVGTVGLAIFTMLLWAATRRLASSAELSADGAAKAADAAARAADVAAASLSLESERWHTESAERDRVHARWVEVDFNTFSGVPQVKVVCTNRGPMSIANVVFHLSIDSSRYSIQPLSLRTPTILRGAVRCLVAGDELRRGAVLRHLRRHGRTQLGSTGFGRSARTVRRKHCDAFRVTRGRDDIFAAGILRTDSRPPSTHNQELCG